MGSNPDGSPRSGNNDQSKIFKHSRLDVDLNDPTVRKQGFEQTNYKDFMNRRSPLIRVDKRIKE